MHQEDSVKKNESKRRLPVTDICLYGKELIEAQKNLYLWVLGTIKPNTVTRRNRVKIWLILGADTVREGLLSNIR